MNDRARVGVFGGEFDPPHDGHLAVARCAIRQLDLDRLVVVPAARPAHRAAPATPAELRLRMAEAVFAAEPRVGVSRIELDRSGPDYTIDTLEALAEEGELFLIVGADHSGFEGWHEPERIVALATLVVAPRPGERGGAAGVIELEMEPVPRSSTEIRRAIAEGADPHVLVPQAVADIIVAEGLYAEVAC